MGKMYEREVMKKYVEQYTGGAIDFSDPKIQKLMLEMQDSILNLIIEARMIMEESGMDPEDISTPFSVMSAVGATLKEVGEINLEKTQVFKKIMKEPVGGKNENKGTRAINGPRVLIKLCQ